MPMSRTWSAFWTVAGFLFLVGGVQLLADNVLTGFTVLRYVALPAYGWITLVSSSILPALAALTFMNWRWGWKPDNAGLRTRPTALFWFLPGLLVGALAGGVAYLITGGLSGGLVLPAIQLDPRALLLVVIGLVGAFTTELIFRGVVVSRFQSDLSGRELLLLAIAMPLVWELIQVVIGPVIFIYPQPDPAISLAGLGTLALSVFLTLLFLRTDSVWLSAGIRAGVGLVASLPLLATGAGESVLGVGPVDFSVLKLPVSDLSLTLVFGVPAVILFLMELGKLRPIRKPGPRRGSQRVVYGKTVRGPWGPH